MRLCLKVSQRTYKSDSLIVGTAHAKYIDKLQTGGLSVDTATNVDIEQSQCVANKMLSYSRDTALQSALVVAKSGRLELEDNILRTL